MLPVSCQWSEALEALAGGEAVVLTDEQTRRSDVVVVGSTASARVVNFLVTHARGLLALVLTPERVTSLRLPPMSASWDLNGQAFTVSIEARQGISTGISAADRARTIRVATSTGCHADDLVSPGHVFPVRARPGGLLAGGGRAEAALALVMASGAGDGAVLTEILDEAGDLADVACVNRLCARFDLPQMTIEAVRAAVWGAALSNAAPALWPATSVGVVERVKA